MSNQQNDYILETFYEDFLEQGHSEKQAQKLAQEKFENEGWAQKMKLTLDEIVEQCALGKISKKEAKRLIDKKAGELKEVNNKFNETINKRNT